MRIGVKNGLKLSLLGGAEPAEQCFQLDMEHLALADHFGVGAAQFGEGAFGMFGLMGECVDTGADVAGPMNCFGSVAGNLLGCGALLLDGGGNCGGGDINFGRDLGDGADAFDGLGGGVADGLDLGRNL